jgi:hypothetical protein
MTRRNQYQNWVDLLQYAPDMVMLQNLLWGARQDAGIVPQGGEA